METIMSLDLETDETITSANFDAMVVKIAKTYVETNMEEEDIVEETADLLFHGFGISHGDEIRYRFANAVGKAVSEIRLQ